MEIAPTINFLNFLEDFDKFEVLFKNSILIRQYLDEDATLKNPFMITNKEIDSDSDLLILDDFDNIRLNNSLNNLKIFLKKFRGVLTESGLEAKGNWCRKGVIDEDSGTYISFRYYSIYSFILRDKRIFHINYLKNLSREGYFLFGFELEDSTNSKSFKSFNSFYDPIFVK